MVLHLVQGRRSREVEPRTTTRGRAEERMLQKRGQYSAVGSRKVSLDRCLQGYSGVRWADINKGTQSINCAFRHWQALQFVKSKGDETNNGGQMRKRQDFIRTTSLLLRIQHFSREDPWYTIPLQEKLEILGIRCTTNQNDQTKITICRMASKASPPHPLQAKVPVRRHFMTSKTQYDYQRSHQRSFRK